MNTAAKSNVKTVQQTSTQKLQQTFPNKCLEKGQKLYQNLDSGDVHFLVGSTDETAAFVPAHKAILAGNSDVFEAMFFGDLKETGDVHVQDSTEAAFMEFLQYFYLVEVKLTAENVAGVLHLGEKYDVKKCVDDCVSFLMNTTDDENVCANLGLAILYEKKKLMDECEKHVMLNTEAVFDSDGFLECDKKVLAHILKMDVLACTEIDVFKASMAWVKAKSGGADPTIELVEQHLGNLYNDIRLTSLPLEQLFALLKQYEPVLTRDFIAITKMIVQPQLYAPNFSSVPRYAKWDPSAIVECVCVINEDDVDDFHAYRYYDDYQSLLTEVVKFSVNKPLILGRLRCNKASASCEGHPTELWTMFKIVEADGDSIDASSKVLSTMKIQLNLDDATDILLPHPILIRPGFVYQICIDRSPQKHEYDPNCLAKEVQLEPDITIEFHKNPDQLTMLSTMYFNKI